MVYARCPKKAGLSMAVYRQASAASHAPGSTGTCLLYTSERGQAVIYLDNAATTLYKPPEVGQAMLDALQTARCV